jgi:hypothetical protein
MRRLHGFRIYICALALAALAWGAQGRGKRSSSASYDGTVDFGAQVLQLEGGCLSLEGTVRSGEFFADLTRVDSGGQPEFRKAGRVVTEYPETLTTSIRLVGGKCAESVSSSPASIFGGDSSALEFEVEWKDGMQLRPATLSPVFAKCVGSRIITDLTKKFSLPQITCEMTVDSHGIALHNHLIVSVYSADGKRLTRLSAAP